MKNNLRSGLRRFTQLSLVLLLIACNTGTAAEWLMLQNRSSLKFQFAQAGSDVTGTFGKFEVAFDLVPEDMKAGHFMATIYLTRLATGDKDRDDILRSADMFNTGKWPVAKFRTLSIEQKGKNQYAAAAELTIRDVTQKVHFPFTLYLQQNKTETLFHMKSTMPIKRLNFGIGQGDWASTEWVGDQVVVMVDIIARKKI